MGMLAPCQPFSAVILVGGFSIRMGRDKAELTREGERLLDRQRRIAKEAGAQEIWFAGRKEQTYGLDNFLPDTASDLGPMSGIASGLSACRTELLLVLAVDLAWMEAPWLAQMAKNGPIVPYLDGQPEPLAAIYPKRSLEIARRHILAGKLSVRAFADVCCQEGLCEKLVVDRPEDRLYFRNWNTPELPE